LPLARAWPADFDDESSASASMSLVVVSGADWVSVFIGRMGGGARILGSSRIYSDLLGCGRMGYRGRVK